MPEAKKLFLSWTYSFEVLQARCNIVEDVLRYALKGAENQYDAPYAHPKAALLKADVKARMYEVFRPLVMPKNGKAMVNPAGDTNELLFAAFEEARTYAMVDQIKAIPHFSSPELTSAFGKKFFARTISMGAEVHPSVEGAFDQARANFQQCESRLVALHSLYTLVSMNQYGNVPELMGFDEIRKTLWERRQKFLRDIAMFGGLLGGHRAKAVACMLARESCHKTDPADVQYSIIQFLTADGVVPGRWSADQDEAFRKDIALKYREIDES